MIFIAADKTKLGRVYNNGSATFINTESQKLIVTCRHVYEEYERLKDRDSAVALAITGSGHSRPFVISDAIVVSRGQREIDLITLRLPDPSSVERAGKRYFLGYCWPPKRTSKGEGVLVTGFPGEHRIIANHKFTAVMDSLSLQVSSSSEKHFCMADDIEDDPRFVTKILKDIPDLKTLGGMSGAPVWRWDMRETITCPALAGFVYESSVDGINSTVFAHHSDFIESDGSIRAMP